MSRGSCSVTLTPASHARRPAFDIVIVVMLYSVHQSGWRSRTPYPLPQVCRIAGRPATVIGSSGIGSNEERTESSCTSATAVAVTLRQLGNGSALVVGSTVVEVGGLVGGADLASMTTPLATGTSNCAPSVVCTRMDEPSNRRTTIHSPRTSRSVTVAGSSSAAITPLRAPLNTTLPSTLSTAVLPAPSPTTRYGDTYSGAT